MPLKRHIKKEQNRVKGKWLDDKTPNDAQDTYFVSNVDVSAIYALDTANYDLMNLLVKKN